MNAIAVSSAPGLEPRRRKFWASHPRRHLDVEHRSMSSEQTPNSLAARTAAAMRRRVGVGRPITVKQLAHAAQISEGTIGNLLAGNNAPSSETLMRLIEFFDASFANEIMGPRGCIVAKLLDAKAASAIRKINEGREELIAATGGKR